ncbi:MULTISPECIES: helix-turn-helix domain-containing protein [Bacillus]|uniref:helix-turn-helix domain-containing protein n=1 Tax=Bacillus TaxID=1386 RepID=UPI00025A9B85|nr:MULTISPECIES: helix-turn-helix transcriptional regulator [Bacillus]AKQ74015.1 transcriptional regulator [Bacillus licheniformis WX-02]MCA1181406.1 helix-turn-helix domain-containing protein [Bacillus licheniformis]MCM3210464.1 helix-turn-helix domain-containing protein [Bacillus licheniformis]MCM3286070.1 helix-turn-helix domain-containing protein [Bacillus licheniformis]MCY7739890.1 helix-turn-helix domain-containing protein [Bacillus licheniformis]
MKNNVVAKLVGRKLREIRDKRNYSQRQLAEKLGVSDSYLSKVEKGQPVSLKLLERIADILNVHISYFFIEDDELNEFSDAQKELLFEPDLSLDKIKEKFQFIKYQDKEVTDDELRVMLNVLEVYRNSKNEGRSN